MSGSDLSSPAARRPPRLSGRPPRERLGRRARFPPRGRAGRASSATRQAAALEQVHPGGVFEGRLKGVTLPEYRLEVDYGESGTITIDDPYRFLPTLGELDLHLLGEGRHEELWDAPRRARARDRRRRGDRLRGVGAERARGVSVVGDFNGWDGRIHPMRALGSSGVWELFVPGVGPARATSTRSSRRTASCALKADPVAFATELPPADRLGRARPAARVGATRSGWRRAREAPRSTAPMSIYEVHLGSWRLNPSRATARSPTASWPTSSPAYVADLGFTHVELLPVMEHPFTGSWGYQVTGYFAPTPRYGTPDDFRASSTSCTSAGIGVILDWVPAHFPRDAFALGRFDGTALYEHPDPRQGEHRTGARSCSTTAATRCATSSSPTPCTGCDEYHVDGLRVDAVASMLYLDYSRKAGEWVPNEHGGNENLEAVAFLSELNEVVHGARAGRDRRRRGVDRVARRLAADLPGRARLRPQVEHGLDARHARRTSAGPGPPPLPPRRADVRPRVRVHRELHPAALARRGGARQGLAARRRCPATAGRSSRTCARCTPTCGRTRQEAAVHGRRARPGARVEPRALARLASARAARARRHAGARPRPQPRLQGRAGAVGDGLRPGTASGGSRPTPPTTTCSRSRARRRTPSGSSVVGDLSPVPRHGYGSACPRAGRWREAVNTDCGATTAAPASATSAASRPRDRLARAPSRPSDAVLALERDRGSPPGRRAPDAAQHRSSAPAQIGRGSAASVSADPTVGVARRS